MKVTINIDEYDQSIFLREKEMSGVCITSHIYCFDIYLYITENNLEKKSLRKFTWYINKIILNYIFYCMFIIHVHEKFSQIKSSNPVL
jgi:hypothetical protein